MELVWVGPSGQLGDEIEFLQELTDHAAGVLALAELFELRHDARERVFGLGDRDVRVVLALALQARMVFQKFFTVEIGEALTGRSEHRVWVTRNVGALRATLQGHFSRGRSQCRQDPFRCQWKYSH